MKALHNAAGEVYSKRGNGEGSCRERLEHMRRNVRLITISKVLKTLEGCMFPCTLLIYFRSKLSDGEIPWLQSIFSIGLAAFLLGGGSFADRVGRKLALVLGSLMMCLGLVLYGHAYSFLQLVLAETTLALGIGLMNGAEHALVFDSLKAMKASHLHVGLRSRYNIICSIGIGASCILGSYLAVHYSLEAPFYIAAAAYLLGTLPLLAIREPRGTQAGGPGTLQLLKEALAEGLLRDECVRRTIVVGALAFNATFLCRPLLQPRYRDLGVPEEYFGMVLMVASLVAGGAMCLNHRIHDRYGPLGSCVLSALLSAVALTLLGGASAAAVIVVVPILVWMFGLQDSVIPDLLNKQVGSKRRAALNSFIPALGRIGYAGLLIPAGIAANTIGVGGALLCMAGFSFLVALIVAHQRGKVN